MRLPRLSTRCVTVALALAASATASTRGQDRRPEWGDRLGPPGATGQAVLETGVGLGRPQARAGASRLTARDAAEENAGDSPVATPGHGAAASTPLPPPGSRAEAATGGELELRMDGNLGPVLRSVVATDLAYVPEVRISAGGRFVLEGQGDRTGGRATVELVLRDRQGGAEELARRFEGADQGVARFLHEAVDELVGRLTGRPGGFASRLLFTRRLGPGRKAVFLMDSDGGNLHRISGDGEIAILPNFGRDAVWYSVATPRRVFITRTGLEGRPVVGGAGGVHMGAAVCGDRLLFASTREGNTDIWSATLDGSHEQRLTRNPAIEVSPTCAPDGRVFFVSDRTGRPQLFSVNVGGGGVEQHTNRDVALQTPSLCADPRRPLLAFTAVGGGTHVMTLDLRTGALRRVSPPGVGHKDPALSPDCRMVAWASPEGVVVATVDGRLRRVVARGHAETVRWGR